MCTVPVTGHFAKVGMVALSCVLLLSLLAEKSLSEANKELNKISPQEQPVKKLDIEGKPKKKTLKSDEASDEQK